MARQTRRAREANGNRARLDGLAARSALFAA
jgi:hypothetical protein